MELFDRRLCFRANNSVLGQQNRRAAILRRRRIQERLYDPNIGLLVCSAFSDRTADWFGGGIAAEKTSPE
ncbi:MAG: hypothetical protein HYX38_09735 [Rhodospirillales bacterium]|nr:hypothetical protein [Rhodospirillales bacterium]